jgi:frataxin
MTTRSLSTTTNNKNNIQSTNHQNTEAILMPENLYHRIADDTMDSIVEMLSPIEDELGEAEIDYAMGVLNIRLGKAGTWVINKQTPNRQLWWSSPLSGPRRYELFVASKNRSVDAASDEELSSLSESGFFEDFGANWYSTRNNEGAIVDGDRLRDGQSLQHAMRSEMKTATGIDI